MTDYIDLSTKYAIPGPDPKIFQYQGSVESIIAEDQTVHIIDKISYDKGIFISYEGADYPKKGFVFPEAIFALNILKRTILESVKLLNNKVFIPSAILFTILPFKAKINLISKVLESFNSLGRKVFQPYIVKSEYLMTAAYETNEYVKELLIKLGFDSTLSTQVAELISSVIQYDDAYRYRFQDVLGELNINSLRLNPKNELKRLVSIYQERETNPGLREKIGKFIKVIDILFISKQIRQSLCSIHLKHLALDEGDKYWLTMRNDGYNYQGLTYEQRKDLSVNKPKGYKIR
jgi:hypothetical protein